LQGQITTSHQEALVRKGFLSALDDRNIRSHVDAVIADQLQIEQQRGRKKTPISNAPSRRRPVAQMT